MKLHAAPQLIFGYKIRPGTCSWNWFTDPRLNSSTPDMLFKCFLLPELSSIQRYIPVSSYRRLLYGSDDADKSLRSGTSEGYDSLQFVQRVLSWPRPNYITSGWRSSSTICITRICTDAGSFNQSLRTNAESPTRCTSFLSVQFRSSCQGRHLELL